MIKKIFRILLNRFNELTTIHHTHGIPRFFSTISLSYHVIRGKSCPHTGYLSLNIPKSIKSQLTKHRIFLAESGASGLLQC